MSERPHDNNSTKPKKKRVSKPKVKTGCITCKIRRVKCDEAKPFCLRCQKFGTQCDGYQEEKPADPRPKVLAKLLPRPQTATPSPERDIDINCERRYMDVFFQIAAPDLAAYFESTFWTSHLVHASQDKPSIRYAVIALGALVTASNPDLCSRSRSSSLLTSNNTSPGPSTPVLRPVSDLRQSSKDHENVAMEFYSRSIQCLKSTPCHTGGCRKHVQTALVTSLLFICFESLQGSFGMAGAQINGAILLLREASPQNHKRLEDEVIDQDLVQIYQRLDSRRKVPTKHSLNGHGIISRTLAQLLDALSAWDASINRAIITYQGDCSFYAEFAAADLELQRLTGYFGDWSEKLRLWKVVARPLISRAASMLSEDWLPETLLLSILQRITAMITQAGRGGDVVDYDEFLPEFKLINMVSKLLINAQRPCSTRTKFSLELGLIPALYLVILKCQQPLTRGEATALLLAVPKQNDLWNEFRAGNLDQFLRVMEDISFGHQFCNQFPPAMPEGPFDKMITSTLCQPDLLGQTPAYCYPPFPTVTTAPQMKLDLQALAGFDNSMDDSHSFDGSISDDWQLGEDGFSGLLVDPMMGLLGPETSGGLSLLPSHG